MGPFRKQNSSVIIEGLLTLLGWVALWMKIGPD